MSANLEMQTAIQTKFTQMGKAGFRFTPQGMHYLACRLNGHQYRIPIVIGLDLMLADKLLAIASPELINKTLKLLGMTTLEPEAVLILATGRKPIFSPSKRGWQEEQASLLKPKAPQPEVLATLSESVCNRLMEAYKIKLEQSKLCTEWLELLYQQFDPHNPPTSLRTLIPKPITEKVVKLNPPKTTKTVVTETPPTETTEVVKIETPPTETTEVVTTEQCSKASKTKKRKEVKPEIVTTEVPIPN